MGTPPTRFREAVRRHLVIDSLDRHREREVRHVHVIDGPIATLTTRWTPVRSDPRAIIPTMAEGESSARMSIPTAAIVGALSDDAAEAIARDIGWLSPGEIEGMARLAAVSGMMSVGAIFGGRLGAVAAGIVTYKGLRHPRGRLLVGRAMGLPAGTRRQLPPGE